MTPQQVARVLRAAADKTHDPYQRDALNAAIAECEAIEQEDNPYGVKVPPGGYGNGGAVGYGGPSSVTVPHPSLSASCGHGGYVHDETCGHLGLTYPHRDGEHMVIGPECFSDLDAKVISFRGTNYYPQPERDTDYGSQGIDHRGSYPSAEIQHSTSGQYHRVCVYFGEDTEQAEHFARWLEAGEWETFRQWRLRQTSPDPLADITVLDRTEPSVKDTAPQDFTPSDTDTQPLHVVEDPNPTMVYHKFEPTPNSDKLEDELFCRHCNGSKYADQHI